VIPTAGNVKFVPWADDVNPYAIAISSLRESVNMAEGEVSLFIDEDSRYFVAEGIKNAADGIQTEIAPPKIRAFREQKSPAEIALLRCANEVSTVALTEHKFHNISKVTLLALRDVQKRMHLGMKESEAKVLILKALADAGLRHPQGWVLFGGNPKLHDIYPVSYHYLQKMLRFMGVVMIGSLEREIWPCST
jgi:Xaa-Pro aminopeptidase